MIDKYNLNIPLPASFQTEAVTFSDISSFYISAEKNALGSAALYSLVSATLGTGDFSLIQHEVYPNPAGEMLSIESKVDIGKIEIYDYLGKKVYEELNPKKDIDISGFSNGVYILKLYGNNRTSSIKFLKK